MPEKSVTNWVELDKPNIPERSQFPAFDEGFSNQLEDLRSNSEILRIEKIGETTISKDGAIDRYGFTTRAGYNYAGLIGRPSQQESDIAVIGTTAWQTSTEGHNEHTLRNVLRQGSPFIFVGAEGSYHDNKPVPRTRPTLARSAAAILSFCQLSNELDSANSFHPKFRHAIGESRGGMVGMGLVSVLDTIYDQDVASADLTAPCFPRRIKFSDLPEMGKQLAHETKEVKSLLGKIAVNVFMHYPSTVDLSPYAAAHQLAILPGLLSGEAGEMAKLIDHDKVIHITTFVDDFMSMESDWRTIFKNNPNTRITPLQGAHITIGDPETLAYVRARIKAVQLAHDKLNHQFTGEDIFAPAHEYVDEILQDVLKHKNR